MTNSIQEGVVSRITDQLKSKLDRTDMEDLQSQIRSIVKSPTQDDLDATYGRVSCLTKEKTYILSILVKEIRNRQNVI